MLQYKGADDQEESAGPGLACRGEQSRVQGLRRAHRDVDNRLLTGRHSLLQKNMVNKVQ